MSHKAEYYLVWTKWNGQFFPRVELGDVLEIMRPNHAIVAKFPLRKEDLGQSLDDLAKKYPHNAEG